ncbi:CAP-Gly domain-containing linker protein 1 isoform X3 [Sebastes umbrosus]|uniref:CAP-Gly domain-containing linker protein 1 isoform X3 n=1 Tax=Sebastes umbrosus TaxID=72105 RepID=UPI00189C8748|nr:CAP-Gly domain-containing linker protein 1 isoform X3 [Sebastes umbrosus]
METVFTTTSVTVKPEGETGREMSGGFKNIHMGIFEGRVVVSQELNFPTCEETQEGVPEYNNEPVPDETDYKITTQRFLEDCEEIQGSPLPEEEESKEPESLQNSGTRADYLLVREHMEEVEEEQEGTQDFKNSFDALLPQETDKPLVVESGHLFEDEEAELLVDSMKTGIEHSEEELESDVELTDKTDKLAKEPRDRTEELLVDFEIDEGLCGDAPGDGSETTGAVTAEKEVRVADETFLESEVQKMTETSFFQESVDAMISEQNSNTAPGLLEDFTESGFLKQSDETGPELLEDAEMQDAGIDMEEAAEAAEDEMQNKNEMEVLHLAEPELSGPVESLETEYQRSDEALEMSNEEVLTDTEATDESKTAKPKDRTSISTEEVTQHVTESEGSYAEETVRSVSGRQEVIDDEILDLWLQTALSEDGIKQQEGPEPGQQMEPTNEEQDEESSVQTETDKEQLVELNSRELVSDTEASSSTVESGFSDQSLSEWGAQNTDTQLLKSTSTGSFHGIYDIPANISDISELSRQQPNSESQDILMEKAAEAGQSRLKEEESITGVTSQEAGHLNQEEEVESKEPESLQNSGTRANYLLVREHMEEEQEGTQDIKNSFDALLPQETEKPLVVESGHLFEDEEGELLVDSMKTGIEHSEEEFESDVELTDETDKLAKEPRDGTEELLVDFEIDEGLCDAAGDGSETTGAVTEEEEVRVADETFLEAEVQKMTETSFFQESIDAMNSEQNSNTAPGLLEDITESGFLKQSDETGPELLEDAEMQDAGIDMEEAAEAAEDEMQNKNEMEVLHLAEPELSGPVESLETEYQRSDEALEMSNEEMLTDTEATLLPQETEKPLVVESGHLFEDEEGELLVDSMKTGIEHSEEEFESDVELTDKTDKLAKEPGDGTEELLVNFEIDEGLYDAAGDGSETTGAVTEEVRVADETFLEAEVQKMTETSFFQESVDAMNSEQNSNTAPGLLEDITESGFLKQSDETRPELLEDAEMQDAGIDMEEAAEAAEDEMQNKNEMEVLHLAEPESSGPVESLETKYQRSDEALEMSNEEMLTDTEATLLPQETEKPLVVESGHLFEDEEGELLVDSMKTGIEHSEEEFESDVELKDKTDKLAKEPGDGTEELLVNFEIDKGLYDAAGDGSETTGAVTEEEEVRVADETFLEESDKSREETDKERVESVETETVSQKEIDAEVPDWKDAEEADAKSLTGMSAPLRVEKPNAEDQPLEITVSDPPDEIKHTESRSEASLEDEMVLRESGSQGDTCTESERKSPSVDKPQPGWSEDVADSLPGLDEDELAEQPTTMSEEQMEVDTSALDFTAQRSRIAVKDPRVRPPKDPRSLLNMPSLEPTPRLSAKVPAGVPLGGLGIGIKLPGFGAGFPVLKKTRKVVREENSPDALSQETKPEEKSDTPKQDEAPHRPKWMPPKHPGFGNPLMSELKNKLKKTTKE